MHRLHTSRYSLSVPTHREATHNRYVETYTLHRRRAVYHSGIAIYGMSTDNDHFFMTWYSLGIPTDCDAAHSRHVETFTRQLLRG